MDDEPLLVLLNDFIIDIIYKHKYFNENEYKYILFSKDGTQAAIQII